MSVRSFPELKTLSNENGDGFPQRRVGLLADTSSQYLTRAIRGEGIARELNLDLFEADYDQIDLQLMQQGSDLHQFEPETVLIYQDVTKLRRRFGKLPPDERASFASRQAESVERYFQSAMRTGASSFIYCNFPVLPDAVFGNFANKTEQSFTWQLRKLNVAVMELAARLDGFHVCDLAGQVATLGYNQVVDRRMLVNADLAMSFAFLPIAAKHVVDIVQGLNGKAKKCLILDLDNTVWGGVIGDDGMANIEIGDLGIGKAFTDLQLWAKQLAQRGIILAVCSKNTDSIARQPFQEHPDMVLKLEDIAVFVANWNNKPDNIRHIQSILNIGFDSMVFLDDNPFERNIVRENIPELTVPELPEDPAEYLPYLETLNLFETVSFSANDGKRTAQYREEAERVEARQGFTDESDFLGSMEMTSITAPFTEITVPRVAQLCQRSNQFNLRTIRYTAADIKNIAESDDYFTLTFTLNDRFGDNGLIGVVILKKLSDEEVFIDTWIMSCRVLKRTMEAFMLNAMVDTIGTIGYARLIGERIPTERNVIVEDLFSDLGFTQDKTQWVLSLGGYEPRETFVAKAKS